MMPSAVGLQRWRHVLVLGVLVGAWQVSAVVLGGFVVASPAEPLRSLGEGVRDGWLPTAAWVTVKETVLGYGLAVVTGLSAGILLGRHRFWGEVFDPLIGVLYSIPKVTLYPVFLLLFGLGYASKVAFGWFHGVFPVLIFTAAGIRTVRPVYHKVARTLGMSPWQRFYHVEFPAALPAVLTGLRFGFSLTFLGTILGEMFASKHGLGFELMQATTVHVVPRVFALILVMVALAVLVNGLLVRFEGKMTRHGGPSPATRRGSPSAPREVGFTSTH